MHQSDTRTVNPVKDGFGNNPSKPNTSQIQEMGVVRKAQRAGLGFWKHVTAPKTRPAIAPIETGIRFFMLSTPN
jgi:hypothetical protein